MKLTISIFFLLLIIDLQAQQQKMTLSVGKIMRDPKWIGTSPSDPFWSEDGKLYFYWNPDKAISDSLYYILPGKKEPIKADILARQSLVMQGSLQYNANNTAYTYSKDGDIFYVDKKSGTRKRITQSLAPETQCSFGFGDSKIIYRADLNLFAWDIKTGETMQLSFIKAGENPTKKNKKETGSEQEKWLKQDQLNTFDVLRQRKEKKDITDSMRKKLAIKLPRNFYIEDKELNELQSSSNGQFISFQLSTEAVNAKKTIVPNYVTQSGFTEEIPSRTKVGAPSGNEELLLYDRLADTIIAIKTDSITAGKVNFNNITWAPTAAYAIVDIRSNNNKDRWLALLSGKSAQLTILDHQHDSAWIGGPGIGWFSGGNIGWINDRQFWFQSEKTGYAHIYLYSLSDSVTTALTTGEYEVQSAQLSTDKKYFYISTNEVHPGEQQFYRLTISNKQKERLTNMTGANQVTISPDEKKLAILYSYSNKPWELYIQENKPAADPVQITNKAASSEFLNYDWRVPELITFKARDGATVYARLYQPKQQSAARPAVIFVHGAGYLQNAHKWWSSYFREYMFHNLLADNGYTVLDIDYRASAGYGRNWRTGIYLFMGGKDLTDNIDGARLLVEKYGVNPKNIGIYGGSYGGFITLMAMFTAPGVFSSGAALRPVTDWAHYNHGYTSAILNEPITDSLAYRQSSPIYHAAGFQGNLLICHGMIDTNVHYEDVVRLSQRLIELGKTNWEVAAYPLEDHGFVEPSSWTDEYNRIFKLFETTLKQ